jgi:hypothetical protein
LLPPKDPKTDLNIEMDENGCPSDWHSGVKMSAGRSQLGADHNMAFPGGVFAADGAVEVADGRHVALDVAGGMEERTESADLAAVIQKT